MLILTLMIEEKIKQIKKSLQESADVAFRILKKDDMEIGFIYLKSMTDKKCFEDEIYQPIEKSESTKQIEDIKRVISANDVSVVEEKEICEKILYGNVVVLLENEKRYIAIDIEDFLTRPPTEPPTSPVIMGPREGFTEDIKTNISLIRRRLHTEKLVLKQMQIGQTSKTKIVVSYLSGVADKQTVVELERRLKKIKIDGVVDSYYLLTLLSDRPDSVLKQVGCAEKPDIIAAKMLEGRVAIIVDNSPIVLTVPFLFLEDLQNSNDYYTNYAYASFVRFIRLLGLFIAVLGPGVYIALELFHINVLPIKYLITIADSTQQIPFTPFIEILFVFLLFQILYEVSLRLPSYLGLATSIVGALILGDTGVKAGLISPPTVIVVAIAKITLYTIPEENAQINLFQFVFLLLGGCLGLLGIVGGMLYVFDYANTIENFGVPYFAPFAPFILSDNKDGILKVPLREMDKMPQSIKSKKKERVDV